MKQLLFLVGLIMVATSCSSGNSGLLNNDNENSPKCCYSIVYVGRDGEGRSDYDFCKAEYHKESESLIISLEGVKKTYLYSKDEILEEYMPQVENAKVTIEYIYGEPRPVVVTKGPEAKISIEADGREFTFTSILKSDNKIESGIPYRKLYLGLYVFGYSNAGNRMFKENRFFFFNKDLTPEKTGDEFGPRGRFSAARTLDNSYTMCQARYEDGYLVIRVEDGSTFRYPEELFFRPYEHDVVTGKRFFAVSAVQIPNANWLPAILNKPEYRDYIEYSALISDASFYFNIFNKEFSWQGYVDYMVSRGITNVIGGAVTEPFFDMEGGPISK